MFIALIMLASSQASDNIPYVYIENQCAAQGDGHQPIFWGIDKGACDDVATVDRRLNSTYKRVMSKLNRSQKNQLRHEQRLWIISKNDVCKLLSDGSIGNLDEVECFMREARNRIDYLKSRGL